MEKRLLLCFFWLCGQIFPLTGQEIICPSVDCGNLNVNFNNEGEVVFCEGSTITLINESAPGFDFFIIEWGDGVVDTLDTYDNPQHQYDIPDSLVCETPQTAFSVNFTGIALCDEGNSCQSGSYEFGIRPEPRAAFSVPQTLCVNTAFSPIYDSCHAESYLWDFGDGTTSTDPDPDHQYATPGQYTITQMVENGCGSDVFTRTVEVVGEPEAAFTASDEDGGCVGTVVHFSDQSNEFSASVWDISPDEPGDWEFTDTLMTLGSDTISVQFLRPITYTVTLTASNVCGNDTEELVLDFEEAPDVELEAPAPACDQATFTAADLGFAISGPYTGISWNFENGDPDTGSDEDFGAVTFEQSGTVILTVTGACGDLEQSVDVVIAENTDITLPTDLEYCSGSSPDTLSAMPGDGEWSGPGVSSDGVFDPASVDPGAYTLTYALNNPPCSNSEEVTITVQESTLLTVPDRIFCIDSPADTLQADPPGGSWSGPGIVDGDAGLFDPAQAGPSPFDPIVYTYIDDNGCEVAATPDITVEVLPVLTLPDSLSLCLSDVDVDLADATGISAEPDDGQFTWAGAGIIDPGGTFNAQEGSLGEGTYELFVTYLRNECSVSDTIAVTLTEDEALVIDPVEPLCLSDGDYQLTTNLTGGVWSGPGVDPQTGTIDLEAAGDGVFDYTYVYQAGTSCMQSGSTPVEIIDAAQGLSAGADEAACEGPATFTLSGGSPANGAWSGPGIVDAAAGTIDLAQLTPGESYTYNYCVESQQVAGCSACDTKTLTFNPKPAAGFSFDGTPCINTVFTLTPDQPGLDYLWDFGDNTTGNEENPTHTYADSGTYVLTLIIITEANCRDTADQELYITNPPTADFALNEDEGCAPFTLDLDNNSFGDDITQQWIINGDTIAGGDPPAYVLDSLADDTTFPILLEVTNLCGTVADLDSVLVRPYPLVDFGINIDEGCSPFSTGINNITLGNPDNFFWQLGPDSTSTEFEPVLPDFTTPDDSVSVFTIQLTATNECGEGSVSKEITVYPPDVEAFIEMDTLAGCPPFTVAPQSFSTPGAIPSWEVIGPDGQITGGDGDHPEFSLPDPGLYTIILYASRCGTDSDTAQVEVLPAPELIYEHKATVCLGDTIAFQNTSPQVGGSLWTFGDGNTSTIFSPVHVYDTADVFTITYTAQSLINNCPATDSSEVTVYDLPQNALSPAVTADCPPLEVAFSNQTTGAGPFDYFWDFGDGSDPSLAAAPVHVFEATGDYTVRMIAFDQGTGCYSDTSTATVMVYPEPVSQFALSDDRFCLGYDTLRAVDQSVGAVGREWRIGGNSYSGAEVVVAPEAVGDFTAQLIVNNSFGCLDTSQRAYTVLTSPVAAFTPLPPAVCVGDSIRFQNQSQFSDGYLWDFGNDTGATEEAPIRIFETAGTYPVSLTATSENGCPDSTVVGSVTIHPKPVAAFSIDRPFVCGAPLEVMLENNSTGNLENRWQFGDGGVSAERNPVYVYEQAGLYEIELLVITDQGCRDTARREIDVFGEPVAEATIEPALLCAGETATLTAAPTDAVRYEWYLPPSLQPDTGRILSFTPEQAGAYDFRLVAVYNDQCRDTLDLPQAVTAFEQPLAEFDFIADESENRIGEVRFLNESENATDYFWDLGDGATSTEPEPFHEYDINREIMVQLIAYHRNDGLFLCTDTIVRPVAPEWIVSFEVPNAVSPDYGEPQVRVFGAVGSGVASYTLEVFSPFGQAIWRTSELEDGHPTGRWDGTHRGEPVQQGAYTWRAEVFFVNGEKRELRGTVTVLR